MAATGGLAIVPILNLFFMLIPSFSVKVSKGLPGVPIWNLAGREPSGNRGSKSQTEVPNGVILPILTEPFTSNFALGLLVPMPTNEFGLMPIIVF
mgnify:CR=1 FL=1